MILAWEKNDREWLEAGLGPTGKAALSSLLENRTWQDMLAELRPDQSDDKVAVGYRFNISGRWAEPEETLEEDRDYGDAVMLSRKPEFEIDTLLKDSSGADCGRHRVKFLKTPSTLLGRPMKYVVDNSDFPDLLKSVATCAARTRTPLTDP